VLFDPESELETHKGVAVMRNVKQFLQGKYNVGVNLETLTDVIPQPGFVWNNPSDRRAEEDPDFDPLDLWELDPCETDNSDAEGWRYGTRVI
jgi:hypothetical protein